MTKTALVKHLEALAQEIKGFVGVVLKAVTAALTEMNEAKADKPSVVSVEIPASGWKDDGTDGYPKYYDLTAAGVTDTDIATVVLLPSAIAAATGCGLCPTCETLTGKIRLRASRIPAAAMTANYWITKGIG